MKLFKLSDTKYIMPDTIAEVEAVPSSSVVMIKLKNGAVERLGVPYYGASATIEHARDISGKINEALKG